MRAAILVSLIALVASGCSGPSVGAIYETDGDPAILVSDKGPSGPVGEWVAIVKRSDGGCLLLNEEGPEALLTTTVWPPGSRIVDGGVEVNGEVFEVGALVQVIGERLDVVVADDVQRCAESSATTKTTPILVETVRRI